MYVSSAVSLPLFPAPDFSLSPTTKTYSNSWWYSGSESSSMERGWTKERKSTERTQYCYWGKSSYFAIIQCAWDGQQLLLLHTLESTKRPSLSKLTSVYPNLSNLSVQLYTRREGGPGTWNHVSDIINKTVSEPWKCICSVDIALVWRARPTSLNSVKWEGSSSHSVKWGGSSSPD